MQTSSNDFPFKSITFQLMCVMHDMNNDVMNSFSTAAHMQRARVRACVKPS